MILNRLYHVYHIIASDISLKLNALSNSSVAESLGISSTTYTQCIPEATTNSVTYCKIRAISPFKVIQGHRFWYQSKAHIRLPISD